MEKDSEIIEIDIFRLLKAVKRKLWLVILAAAVCGAMAFYYASYYVSPTYSASALMYVNSGSISLGSTSLSIAGSEVSAAKSLVDTYIVIMKTRATLTDVIEKADLDYSYEELYSMVSGSSFNGTAIFSITVTSHDPVEAKEIANTIADILPDRIADIMNGSFVKVVDYAVTPTQKQSLNVTKTTGIGVVVGILLSGLFIVVNDLRDDLIRDADMLPGEGEIPVLAEIPNLNAAGKGHGYYSYASYGKQPAAYGRK